MDPSHCRVGPAPTPPGQEQSLCHPHLHQRSHSRGFRLKIDVKIVPASRSVKVTMKAVSAIESGCNLLALEVQEMEFSPFSTMGEPPASFENVYGNPVEA